MCNTCTDTGQVYHFMDLDTYEQPAISQEILGEAADYLKENLEVKLTFYDGEPLDIELPTSVDLLVVQANVAVRGDTATGVTKKVTTETGLQVSVPNFVEEGDTIRVDTRNGAYLTTRLTSPRQSCFTSEPHNAYPSRQRMQILLW